MGIDLISGILITWLGNPVSVKASRKLSVSSGAYSTTGTNVGLLAQRLIKLSSGGYAVEGTPVAFKRTYILPLQSGSYTLTGKKVALIATQVELAYDIIMDTEGNLYKKLSRNLYMEI